MIGRDLCDCSAWFGHSPDCTQERVIARSRMGLYGSLPESCGYVPDYATPKELRARIARAEKAIKKIMGKTKFKLILKIEE